MGDKLAGGGEMRKGLARVDLRVLCNMHEEELLIEWRFYEFFSASVDFLGIFGSNLRHKT